VKRGEVWWAEEPADSPRPYLVLTRDQAIPSLNKLIVAPATRTIRNIPTEVELSREDGMGVECARTGDQLLSWFSLLLPFPLAVLLLLRGLLLRATRDGDLGGLVDHGAVLCDERCRHREL
jgi:PemK-like, MazF-like toxin of type II toxin-antitoxin system